MKIHKAKLPLEDGKTYYLPVTFEASIEPIAEGGGAFSTPGGRCLILSPKSVKQLREEASPIYRCRDCVHAQQGVRPIYVMCKYGDPFSCWHKMSKACEHFEKRKEQQ